MQRNAARENAAVAHAQLMELAGLSVASALHLEYDSKQFPRVMVLVGPGNNGGGASWRSLVERKCPAATCVDEAPAAVHT